MPIGGLAVAPHRPIAGVWGVDGVRGRMLRRTIDRQWSLALDRSHQDAVCQGGMVGNH